MLPESVDALLRCKNFTQAMQSVGWAVLTADGTVDVVHWGEHNGKGAKSRVQNAVDVANCKANKKGKGKEEVRVETLPRPDLEKEKEYNKMGIGRATLDSGTVPDGIAGLPPAPPHEIQAGQPVGISDGFAGWIAALSPCHPSLRQSRTLAPDVEEAAQGAYERCPQAAQYGEMLTAYFADRLQEDRHRKAFYRPTGQRKFFEHLEDVISHAERWDKETGWSRKRKRAAEKAAQRNAEESLEHRSCSLQISGGKAGQLEEEPVSFDDLKRELGMEVKP